MSDIDEKFERWWDSHRFFDKDDAIFTWNAAIESTKAETQFGCHIGFGNPYPYCVLDTDDISECDRAETLSLDGKSRADCEHWKPV
jgi:hypothetical protein